MTDKYQYLVDAFSHKETKEKAFREIIEIFQKRIYWHIRKMVIDHNDADDICQDTFIKVWNHLGEFRSESSLFTWIYRIATNECLNFLQKKRKRLMLPIVDVEKELAAKIDNPSVFTGDEIAKKLQKAILKLPEKQRLVFNMRYFDELSYEEISTILGTSIGGLKASYHLAIKKLELSIPEQLI